jgi:hypothetical protein
LLFWLWGRREAPAFFLPFVIVVLGVGHHLQDEDLLARVQRPGDEAVLVAADVEDDAIADQACRA